MTDQAQELTAKERKEVESATNLAELGNGSLLRDLVQNEKDFDKHTKIINAMLNLNEQHLTKFEIDDKAGLKPEHVPKLKLEQVQRSENGELLIVRSLTHEGKAIFREVYNSTKKEYLDRGSTPRPSGIIPGFIPRTK